MVRRLDRDEDRDAEAELLRVEQRDTFFDHARGLEPPDALPARCLRQADLVGDRRDRHRAVRLQEAQNFAVDTVHPLAPVWAGAEPAPMNSFYWRPHLTGRRDVLSPPLKAEARVCQRLLRPRP